MAQLPSSERTEAIKVNKPEPAVTLFTMEVLNAATTVTITILGTRAEMTTSKHIPILAGIIFRAILATIIEISGVTTTAHVMELQCLNAIPGGKISGGAMIRIVHVRDKIIVTAMPATTIALNSIETEISATQHSHLDITVTVLGVMQMDILIRVSNIRINRQWHNTADGQARISANMKIRSAEEFGLMNIDKTLHLQGQIVV
jgi:hypothetical protein